MSSNEQTWAAGDLPFRHWRDGTVPTALPARRPETRAAGDTVPADLGVLGGVALRLGY